jgi:hypothetical protein
LEADGNGGEDVLSSQLDLQACNQNKDDGSKSHRSAAYTVKSDFFIPIAPLIATYSMQSSSVIASGELLSDRVMTSVHGPSNINKPTLEAL